MLIILSVERKRCPVLLDLTKPVGELLCCLARNLAGNKICCDVHNNIGLLFSIVFGQIHYAWIKLDFKETTANSNYKIKQFSPQYGFELEKSVAKLPIKKLTSDTQGALKCWQQSKKIDCYQHFRNQLLMHYGMMKVFS
ncbi:hypothetical protein [Dyadobacter sp. SG02]|uniref:hypothetical protein n=1 Tax=Dyadobacter sp. SG02 TaxID=1855291 RepID=UPI000B8863B5